MSTRTCPGCGTTDLVRLESLGYKSCVDCHCSIPWSLEKGQAPLNPSNRGGRVPPNEWPEARMDVIGQNGNDGEHYND